MFNLYLPTSSAFTSVDLIGCQLPHFVRQWDAFAQAYSSNNTYCSSPKVRPAYCHICSLVIFPPFLWHSLHICLDKENAQLSD